MSMREVVERVVGLSREFGEKSAVHEAEHGMEGAVAIGERRVEHFVQATRFLDRKLASYLASIPENQVRELESLMYFGRDSEEADLASLHQHVKSTSPTVEDAIRTITEKIGSLSTYLLEALQRTEQQGIDIEMPFEK